MFCSHAIAQEVGITSKKVCKGGEGKGGVVVWASSVGPCTEVGKLGWSSVHASWQEHMIRPAEVYMEPNTTKHVLIQQIVTQDSHKR